MIRTIGFFSSLWMPCDTQNEKKHLPFSNLKDLRELANCLTATDCNLQKWKSSKEEIKHFISNHAKDENQLHEFFAKITEWGFEQDIQETMNLILDISSVDILTKAVAFKQKNTDLPFKTILDWAKMDIPFVLAPCDQSVKASCLSEWKKVRPMILYFIPNLIQIFIGAFGFLDPQKKFTSLWEKYLLLDIIYKFFSIPLTLVYTLEPLLIVTTKIYAVATAIILGTGILIACYQRWLRPMPDEIIHCSNLDKEMEKGRIEPKVEQDESQELEEALLGDLPVLIIGRSGEGKTALVHHFIRKKYEKKLPENLQKLGAFEVDCGSMISSAQFEHDELINQIKEASRGFEENMLFFFDEIDRVAAKDRAFQAFKSRFLNEKPRSKIVATISTQEYEKLKKMDDGSIERRFAKIFLKSPGDDQNEKMIREYVQRKAYNIPISEDAIKKLLEVANTKGYKPEIGRPSIIIKILDLAIGKCRYVYDSKYISKKIDRNHQKFVGRDGKKRSMELLIARNKGNSDPKIKEEYNELLSELEESKKTLIKHGEHIQRIKKIMTQQHNMKVDHSHITHKVVEGDKGNANVKNSNQKQMQNPMSQKDQMKYLWYSFYAFDALKISLTKEISQVASKHLIQIDAKMIEQIFEDCKNKET